jgi:hypothetical protein
MRYQLDPSKNTSTVFAMLIKHGMLRAFQTKGREGQAADTADCHLSGRRFEVLVFHWIRRNHSAERQEEP